MNGEIGLPDPCSSRRVIMGKHDPYGEFAYRRDMRHWKRQSQILHVAAGALIIGLLFLFAWAVGL